MYPRPTVAVLSTGDELVEPTTQYLSHGQVVHSLWLDNILTFVTLCYSRAYGVSIRSVASIFDKYLHCWILD